jgi:hypothetical protein
MENTKFVTISLTFSFDELRLPLLLCLLPDLLALVGWRLGGQQWIHQYEEEDDVEKNPRSCEAAHHDIMPQYMPQQQL